MPVTLAVLIASMLLTPAIQFVPNLARAADGIRFNTSFRGVGVAITDFTGGNDRASDVAIDSQNRIVTAGMATVSANNTDFAIIRFSPTGSLDTSLRNNGPDDLDQEIISFLWEQIPRIGMKNALEFVSVDRGEVFGPPDDFSIALPGKLKADSEVTVKVKVKISEELIDLLTGDPLLLSIFVSGYVHVESASGGLFDDCASAHLFNTRIDLFDSRPTITRVEAIKKALRIFVSRFADFDTMEATSIEAQASGPIILLNGEPQKTKPDEDNPTAILVAPKSGKKINIGETVKIKVQKADGTLSSNFIYTRPQ